MRRILSIVLIFLLVNLSFANMIYALEENDQRNEIDNEASFPILITEVYPDDKSNEGKIDGAGKNDLFEFVEIYNHTDTDIDFNSLYKIRYDYINNIKDLKVTAVDDENSLEAIIPANSPAVLWVERTTGDIVGQASELTEEDFRTYHSIPAEVPVYKLRGQDGLNNSERGFIITNKDDNDAIMSEVFYTKDDVGDGLSLHTRVPKDGLMLDSYIQKGEPTPGQVGSEQLIPTENIDPVIQHDPIELIEVDTDLIVSANVSDEDGDPLIVTLNYRVNNKENYTEVEMELASDNNYTHTISSDHLVGEKLYYYFEANDGKTVVQSEVFESSIKVEEEAFEIPLILITEMSPNPSGDYRKGSGNQYEFIEVYNNSDEVLNLKDYTLFYLYPDSANTKQWTFPNDTAIEPYHTTIIWFAKEAVSAGYTDVEDFNTHFNSTLEENEVIFYDNGDSSDFNLPNSLHRGFAISSSDSLDDKIVEAWYDATPEGEDKLIAQVRNSVIRYTYPELGKEMKRLDTRSFANPGNIDKGQVPEVEGIDVVAPEMDYNQEKYNIGKNNDYSITFTSDKKLEKAKVVYGDGDAKKTTFSNEVDAQLLSEEAGIFTYEAILNMLEPGVYRYMVVGEDSSGNITKLPYNSLGYSLTVQDDMEEIPLPDQGLSINDGDMLHETVSLYAYGNQFDDRFEMKMDHNLLDLKPALPGIVHFGFQANGIEHIYQTSASAKNPAGEREYFARLLPKYIDNVWYSYEMAPDYFVSGSTVSIHAGSENVPYDLDVHEEHFNKTNFDDFDVKNIHLELPDGTMVMPKETKSYLGNKSVTTAPYMENIFYNMGDGGAPTNTNFNKPMKIDFEFDIPEDKWTARYAEIDTTAYADGVYELELKINSDFSETISVTVDNTAPEINGITYGENNYVVDGEVLKGTFVFDVDAEDHLTGVHKVEATLDGEEIEFPYETSSAKLAQGEHELSVTVYDGAGNETIDSVTFQIGTEAPNEPESVSPEGSVDVIEDGVKLEATVIDPTGDNMDVQFLEGSKYDFTKGSGVTGYTHHADREPPLTLESEGEEVINEADQAKIASEDGEYLVSDSTSGFPYHRFEVEVDEEIKDDSVVELYWKGKTLPNRIVTLYGWDYEAGKWSALKSATGDQEESDIILTAEVDVDTFVKDGKIQAMVQDEVENPNDPFTMLWWTDTQFYAEYYPDTFDRLGDWIVDEYGKGTFEYAIHTGDIVNTADSDAQWEIADRNLKKLDDANVPYGVLAGNHDVIIDGVDYSYYHKYVGADRFKDKPWYGGDMDNNRNHYDLVSFGGHDFIVMYLGFGTEDTEETIAWANAALEKHADRNAILGLHAYLEYNATLSNMAQNVFDEIIATNDNVIMAIGWHYHGVAKRITPVTNSDGTTRNVIEMLADYQGGPNGGDGYIRLLTFDPVEEVLDVVTYSPILDEYNFFEPEIDSFQENIQLKDINKRVATDYFSVNIYSNELIGSVENVASGDVVSTVWNGLESNQDYYWYMNITDEYGATRRSEIYQFATGDVNDPSDNEDAGDVDGEEDDADTGDSGDVGGEEDDTDTGDPSDVEDEEDVTDTGDPSDDSGDNHPDGGDSNDVVNEDESENTVGDDPKDDNDTGSENDLTNQPAESEDGDVNHALPSTATNMYNWIIVGLTLLAIGLGIYVARRKMLVK